LRVNLRNKSKHWGRLNWNRRLKEDYGNRSWIQTRYVFTKCASPFHSGVYVYCHFANIVTRESTPCEHAPKSNFKRWTPL